MSEKHVKLLLGARKLIEDKIDDFICHAIQHEPFNLGYFEYRKESDDILEYISRAIHPHVTLEDWLEEKLGTKFNHSDDKFQSKVRNHRLKWIDKMIEEWKD